MPGRVFCNNPAFLKKLQFSGNQEWCRIRRMVRHRHLLPAANIGNDLIPEREECVLVGVFIPLNLDGRDFKGIIPLREDLVMGEAFEIHPYVEHQHVEMQQLFLLHTVTSPHEIR